MKLVVGHVALWGWCMAAFKALNACNSEYLASLVQAALTATIQGNIVQERWSLALLSIAMSNNLLRVRSELGG